MCPNKSFSKISEQQVENMKNGRHLKKTQNNRQMHNCNITARLGWSDCHTFVSYVICMAVRLGWTECHTFVSYLYGSKACMDWLPYICLLFVWQLGLHGLPAIHLSLICIPVRLGWTDCHTCLLFPNVSHSTVLLCLFCLFVCLFHVMILTWFILIYAN